MDDKDNPDAPPTEYERGYKDGYAKATADIEAVRARNLARLRDMVNEYDKDKRTKD